MIPSNQLLLPTCAIKFKIMEAKNTDDNSKIENTKVKVFLIIIPTIIRIGTAKRAIWVPEPAAIQIDISISPFLAWIIVPICFGALLTIPIIIAPTKSCPRPNSSVFKFNRIY